MFRNTGALALAAVVVVVAVVAAVVLIGDDDGGETSDTDAAFIASMVPHHDSAIEMATIAQDRAQTPEIRALAADIIETQSTEIDAMNSISERLYGEPVDEVDAGSLGMSMSEMGMSMDASSLETAKPFDRAFIDMMVPHHQGAILMAEMELADGTDAETRALAEDIIAAQSQEIREMNGWRTEWFGGPSPAGGVPEADEMSHSSMAG